MPPAIQARTDTEYPAAGRPTMYFIGMTTGNSSIMRVFPEWARALGLNGAQLQGVDCRWHDDPETYRRIVSHIKADPMSRGALVTSHKIDLLNACRDLFDELDPYAAMMGEVGSIYKQDGRLLGRAVDPVTSGLALDAFLPREHWARTGGEVFVLGAGGSSIAVTHSLMKPEHGANRPSHVHVANRSRPRLDAIREYHESWATGIPVMYTLTPEPEAADAICSTLKPGSMVINATGLGKDAPGSPLTGAAEFPDRGVAWEFNYRGDLLFLEQARAQAGRKHLLIEDGWVYFLHGWTRVTADVFDLDIPSEGPLFEKLAGIAAAVR